MCTLAIRKKVYNVVQEDTLGTYDIYLNGVLEEYAVEKGFIIGYFSQILRTEL